MGEFIEANNVLEDACNRKTLKPLTKLLIPEVEFHRPPKANQSDRLSVKKTRDTTIHLVEKKRSDDLKKRMYFLTLHSSYGRQLIAVQNGCFQ